MNVEFIMHGAISGQSFSKPSDQVYCRQFYSPQDAKKLMKVDVAIGPLGVCSYCSYIRSGDVNSKREGSYFGISVRIDGFVCTDVVRMWQVLDSVFQKVVIGKILTPIGDVYKYCVDNFQCPAVVEAENRFLNLFGSTFLSGDFMPISDKNVFAGEECVRLNPEDAEGFDVENVISRRARICISPLYPTKQVEGMRVKVDALGKELCDARQQQELLTAELAETKRQLEEANAELSDVSLLSKKGQAETKAQEGDETKETSNDNPKDKGEIPKKPKWYAVRTELIVWVNCALTLAILIFLIVMEYRHYLIK